MGKTSIEWTDHSWPVLNGCRRVSEGCRHCYAERLTATRLSHTPKYKGLAVYGKNGPRWTGESRLWIPHLDMPLRLRKPSRIFVCDMGDLFFEGNSNEDIAAVFGVMAAAPKHTFQVLTKRAERMRDWFGWAKFAYGNDRMTPAEGCRHEALNRIEHRRPDGSALPGPTNALFGYDTRWPLPNVWLGVSVEDQATADKRIPLLLQTPAAVRFVSYEPALGPVDFAKFLPELGCYGPALDWLIVGGESGPGARPFDVAWARSTVEACKAAGVACFVKQLGAHPEETFSEEKKADWQKAGIGYPLVLRSKKGGEIQEWPEDLRVREFPRRTA